MIYNHIILIIFLLLCSAFFSGSETTLFSLSRSQLQRLKDSVSPFDRQVIKALSRPRDTLISILLGNELVNVAIAILVAALIYQLCSFWPWQVSILVSVVVSTPLIIVLGEVIPKNIGIRFAPQLAPFCVLPLRLFSIITYPIRRCLLFLADQCIKLFGGDPKQVRSMIMEEEFRQMVELGKEEGLLDEGESELIHGVFELGDWEVGKIMTPIEQVFSLSLDEDFEIARGDIRATQFSRIPVYDRDPKDIVGILHLRDLFPVIREQKVGKLSELKDIVRPANFFSQHTTLEQVLKQFQHLKVNMAIVVDEEQAVVGLVTMDDIIKVFLE